MHPVLRGFVLEEDCTPGCLLKPSGSAGGSGAAAGGDESLGAAMEQSSLCSAPVVRASVCLSHAGLMSRMLSGEAVDEVSSLQPAQRPCSVLLWRTNASPDTHIPLPQVEAGQCRNYRGNAVLQEPRVLLLLH